MRAFDYCTKEWVTITSETCFERFIEFQNGETDERFIEDVATSDELLNNYLNQCEQLVLPQIKYFDFTPVQRIA